MKSLKIAGKISYSCGDRKVETVDYDGISGDEVTTWIETNELKDGDRVVVTITAIKKAKK